MATNNLSSTASTSVKTTTDTATTSTDVADTSTTQQAMLSGTLPTDTASSIGVNLTDDQKNTVYDTSANGKLDTADRYTGTNTKSYVDQLSQQYDQTQSDYDTTADSAVSTGVQNLQNIESQGQNNLDQMRSQAVRDYNEAVDTREAIEANNGNRDGIGHSQYGSLEIALSQRLGEIQTAADELTQNVANQIVQLRQQGEYEKANSLYATTQAKLQAMYEEQLRIDTNLRSNYETVTSQDMEDKETAAEEDAENLSYLRQLGQTLISMGIMPDDEILNLMGIDKATVQAYMGITTGGSGSGSSSGTASGGTNPDSEKKTGANYKAGDYTTTYNNVVSALYSGDTASAKAYYKAAYAADTLTANQGTVLGQIIKGWSGVNSSGIGTYKLNGKTYPVKTNTTKTGSKK